MAKEAELQMKQDSKISQKELPKTGPGSGSLRSRSTESESPRYPPHFLGRTKRLEAEAPVHLEAVKQHFTQTLGTSIFFVFGGASCLPDCQSDSLVILFHE
jgi:hypothetical protein